jgi:Na+/melibiose symporter-like transporter
LKTNAQQTPPVKLAMNAVINILPSVLFLLAIIPFLMIKMDNKKAAKNTKILLERNQEKM